MNPLQQLGFGRIAVGAGAWAAPQLTGPLGVGGPPENHLAARLFGARDVALGLGTLAFSGEAQKAVVRLGVLCDALDFAASIVGVRQGSLAKPQAAALAVIAGGATVLGLTQAR